MTSKRIRKPAWQEVIDTLFEYSKKKINRRSGAMPITAVALVEFMDKDGKYIFVVIDDPKAPRWRKVGMLYQALDEFAIAPEPEEEEEE